MEESIRFVALARSGRLAVTDLCDQVGISRKTGYRHLERYAELGLAGLQPRTGGSARTARDGTLRPRFPGVLPHSHTVLMSAW
jgi:transposase